MNIPRSVTFVLLSLAALRGSGWNPETATINFEIQPRFYQRPWFLPLAGLLLA